VKIVSVHLTANAARRIQQQLQERGRGLGLRLGVRKAGCSGFAYTLDYADEVGANDLVFEADGAKVVVARDDVAKLEGITVDYRREGLAEAYRFDNPQAKALCGCGESFYLEKAEA
jgi:iron-sulfur cluster assembly protein